MLRRLLAASLILSLVPAAGRADEVTDHLDKARRHYEAGSLGKASTELQWAMVRLRVQLEALARESAPPAPAGWRVDPIVATHAMNASFGVHFTLNYRSEVPAGTHVNMQVAIDALQMFGHCNNHALLNPIYAQLQGYTAIELDGLANPALIRVNEAQRYAEGLIVVPGRVCVYMRGNGTNPGEAVRALITGWNIRRLKSSFDIP
jgi:hypothetical protein